MKDVIVKIYFGEYEIEVKEPAFVQSSIEGNRILGLIVSFTVFLCS